MDKLEQPKLNFFAKHAKIVVILAVLSGSTSGILGKMITAGSMVIGFYRLAFCLPFFAIPVLLYHRDEIKALTKGDWSWCALAGFFLFFHFFSWFKAVHMTTIASAIVLSALHPLVVLVVTILIWKQKVNRKAIAGILIALFGGAIVAGLDYTFEGSFIGNLLALCAAVGMGLYFCVGLKMRERIPAGTYVFLIFAFCWFFFLIGMLATGTPFIGYPPMDWIWMILMTLLCQIGAHAVFNWSLGYVSPLYISTWETSEIVLSPLLAFLVLSELPTAWQIGGAIIVIAGLLWYNFNEEK